MASPVPPTMVFMLLNGANDGLYFTWHDGCLHAVGHMAAVALGADADWVSLGIRLYNQQGHIVQDAADVRTSGGILHVLLEFQVWVWPGIAVGYTTTVQCDHPVSECEHPPITLTTLSLSPKVFGVSGFVSQDDADAILSQGQPHLDRSRIDDKGVRGISTTRTSHTAFLPPSQLTRQLQVRAAKLARLPSPSFAERTQLVRYAPGEYYKRHLDTFNNKQIVPKPSYNYTDFEDWAAWAAAAVDSKDITCSSSNTTSTTTASDECWNGHKWYPNASSTEFTQELLRAFWNYANATNYFSSRLDKAWDEWLDVNLHANASGIMKVLMESKGEYLPTIVRVWEAKAGNFPHLRYTFPKRRPPHGMSQWYRWVRNTKETIASLSQAAPELIQPYGDLYPKFNTAFETKVLTLLRVRIATGGVTNVLSNDWLAWLDENNGRRNVLLQLVQEVGSSLVLHLIQSWELQVQFAPVTGYTLPLYVPHIPPQRFATLFVYVNSVDAGGETAFPFATSSHAVNRSTMTECNQGLAVPPVALQAALFYVQTPTMEVDEMASHGGCPPRGDNVKWGANQFMWNADAEEGAAVWLDST
ncbi:hypothetical protein, variant 1 [Aphanomyces astaci]|nr:hypothetical protein, variant 1 [Aphanomyces astaci]ETV71778.1 hypothetical protein, variant 1 [Aphanomyces astaci]|eukprot:XP_009838629.1 hypothetical protein, variant 1 [Aphanomyces astaci]